ncbi:MAG: hypothetical protein BWY92_00114 [Firmicutes bacterium ADurb.BinA052]|nr:MAG: hypothetical protein BWY92_00114 [Firmicutes bacterium ADurb.BinA052]
MCHVRHRRIDILMKRIVHVGMTQVKFLDHRDGLFPHRAVRIVRIDEACIVRRYRHTQPGQALGDSLFLFGRKRKNAPKLFKVGDSVSELPSPVLPLLACDTLPHAQDLRIYLAYSSSKSLRSLGLSRRVSSAICACPRVYPFPMSIVTSWPTPSAPRAAAVKLVAMLKK